MDFSMTETAPKLLINKLKYKKVRFTLNCISVTKSVLHFKKGKYNKMPLNGK